MLSKKDEGYFDIRLLLWMLAITVFFCLSLNAVWKSNRLIWYSSLLLVTITYFFAFKGKMIFRNISFFAWIFSFFTFGAISIMWSLTGGVIIDILKSFVVVSVVLAFLQTALECGFSVEKMLGCYLLATMVNLVYIFVAVDVAELGKIQLGTELIEGWNGNGIGFMGTNGVLIACHLSHNAKRRIAKIGYLICILALSVLTIYTGSRTAFIMLVAEVTLYYSLVHPAKLLRNSFIFVGGAIFAFYIVMNVDAFYNVLGYRLEGLFALFTGEGVVDSSANIRNIFIENGIKWFEKQPLLGYGMNNYRVLNQYATGRFAYAHNNFVEIAVDLGIVGFIWYYSVYAYLIVKLLKNLKKRPICVFLLSALLASLLSHYGTVSYYNFYQNFLLLLCFFAVNVVERGAKS